MKLLIVGFYDDNFGDNLIRICFERLLKAALENLNFSESDYELKNMDLRQPQAEYIAWADLICFAGGGLFGISYLHFSNCLQTVLETADKNGIPVVFSSVGINNMGATPENDELLYALLEHPCIKAVSVRENPEWFLHYTRGRDLKIRQVCDPALWARYVYPCNIRNPKRENRPKLIGLMSCGAVFSVITESLGD